MLVMASKVVLYETIHQETISPYAPVVADSVDEHVAIWAKEMPWIDPLKEEIFMRMHIVTRSSSRNRRTALENDQLRLWEYKILMILRRKGHPYTSSPSELARLLSLSKGALSNRVGELEQRGLVARQPEDGDRRRVRVSLTPAGVRAFESMAGVEDEAEAALLQGLADDERQTLAALLRKLTDALN